MIMHNAKSKSIITARLENFTEEECVVSMSMCIMSGIIDGMLYFISGLGSAEPESKFSHSGFTAMVALYYVNQARTQGVGGFKQPPLLD